MRIIVGITGASGSLYAYSLVRALHHLQVETYVIATEMGRKVMKFECGIDTDALKEYATVLDNSDLFSAIASGSVKTDGMVVVPCSMNSLGAIANGVGDTLMSRAASVVMKEQRKLIVVPREAPLHLIHLENMVKLSKAGAMIMPAAPGFYHRPKEVWELVNFIVARILDAFDIEHNLMKRWRETPITQ